MGATSMTFDQETGEIAGPTIAERALAAGRGERADRAERKHRQTVGEASLNQKIDSALGEIQPVIKNNKLAKEKEGQRGDYTSLDRLVAILIPKLRSHGVMVRWNAGHVFNMDKTYWLPVTCYLIDKDTGDSVECCIPMPMPTPTPHAVVSAFTYGRRNTFLGVTGLATGDEGEDDNGEAAMPREISADTEDDEIVREIEATKTEADANKVKAAYHARIQQLEGTAYKKVKHAFQEHVKTLRAAAKDDGWPGPDVEPAPKKKPGPKNRIAATHNGGNA